MPTPQTARFQLHPMDVDGSSASRHPLGRHADPVVVARKLSDEVYDFASASTSRREETRKSAPPIAVSAYEAADIERLLVGLPKDEIQRLQAILAGEQGDSTARSELQSLLAELRRLDDEERAAIQQAQREASIHHERLKTSAATPENTLSLVQVERRFFDTMEQITDTVRGRLHVALETIWDALCARRVESNRATCDKARASLERETTRMKLRDNDFDWRLSWVRAVEADKSCFELWDHKIVRQWFAKEGSSSGAVMMPSFQHERLQLANKDDLTTMVEALVVELNRFLGGIEGLIQQRRPLAELIPLKPADDLFCTLIGRKRWVVIQQDLHGFEPPEHLRRSESPQSYSSRSIERGASGSPTASILLPTASRTPTRQASGNGTKQPHSTAWSPVHGSIGISPIKSPSQQRAASKPLLYSSGVVNPLLGSPSPLKPTR